MSRKSDEIADLLNGVDYLSWRRGDANLPKTFQLAKDHGCVIVYGMSDDEMEIRGYIEEEIGAFDGNHVYIGNGSLLEKRCDECGECPYYENEKNRAFKVTLEWDKNDYTWWADTVVPYSAFEFPDMDEENDKYCRGIVIDLNEAKEWMEVQK